MQPWWWSEYFQQRSQTEVDDTLDFTAENFQRSLCFWILANENKRLLHY